MIKFTIVGELMDLNRFINAQRTNRFGGNHVKQENTRIVVDACESAGLPHVDGSFDLDITWYAPNRRKDPDNIAFGVKFILDGLQVAGVIDNDGWNQIVSINHKFKLDKSNPRIEIKLKPKKEGK